MGSHLVFQCDACGVEQRVQVNALPDEWMYLTIDADVADLASQRRFLICSVCRRTARLQVGAALLWPPCTGVPLSAPALAVETAKERVVLCAMAYSLSSYGGDEFETKEDALAALEEACIELHALPGEQEATAENLQRSVDEAAVVSEILTVASGRASGHELADALFSIDDGTVTTRTGTYRITASRT